jgi:hypothetical protein
MQGPGGAAAPFEPDVDRDDPAPGIPARGYEPAVVSLEVGGAATCAGALVASDVVVTARRCVSVFADPLACPDSGRPAVRDLSPGDVVVRTGDYEETAVVRARGRAILVSPGDDFCDADIALLLLDTAVDGVAPFVVSATGTAAADHVRTVAWVDGALVLRDHVVVLSASSSTTRLHERLRPFGAGGPALDETKGEVVGIGSRVDGAGASGATVYVRADAFESLFQEAMAESAFGSPSTEAHLLKAHDGPADMGATCAAGADCAAGDCVALGAARYCSRACGPTDRCPATFRCEIAQGGGAVCVKT